MELDGLDGYARQSRFSDPGRYVELIDALPSGVREVAGVARNVIAHYRNSGIGVDDERLADVDCRWLERILETDQRRHGRALAEFRPLERRVGGCCRDYTLFTVAALRHRGVPARSRVGFATYFALRFRYDHVIAEYWDGARWVWVDAQLDPAQQWGFDPCDMPRRRFVTAAQAWTAYRAGKTNPDSYGVAPELPYRGGWFMRNYVLQELAHRMGDELLLWDQWGVMSEELDGDLELIDDVAALLLAADTDDTAAKELAQRYATDARLRPGDTVRSVSPTGVTVEARIA